jgi:hypothetical protein
MTHPENGKPLWEESRVEALLEEFFRREMPAALRGENPPRFQANEITAPSPPSVSNSRANSKAGGLMVGFTSLLMLMVVTLVWNPAPQDTSDPGSKSRAPSSDTSNAESDDDGDASDALRHNSDGPVELRPRIHNVGTEDPNHPGSEKSPFPELDVEVYPLDGEAPANRSKSRKPESSETPMPEEHRELPEGQPRGSDPDEARIEPMLPELQAIVPML